MNRIKMKNPLFVYGTSAMIVVALGFILRNVLSIRSFLYSFLFRSWPIQLLSTWLFLIGILYWFQRYSLFKREEVAFQNIIVPETYISQERAEEILRIMPDIYKETLTLRRFRELLRAFLYGEEVIRLNEELSRRDMAEVERGHLILNSLRTIIPVIGFLGTVLGLSLGIVKFPEISDVAVLKPALKDFAASLSVAFDTTLLALAYTIIVIILTAFLRQREESLVSKVDSRARVLMEKIKFRRVREMIPSEKDGGESINVLNDILIGWKDALELSMRKFSETVSSQNEHFVSQTNAVMKELGTVLAQKFDELKDEFRRSPQYQLVVRPVNEREDDR